MVKNINVKEIVFGAFVMIAVGIILLPLFFSKQKDSEMNLAAIPPAEVHNIEYTEEPMIMFSETKMQEPDIKTPHSSSAWVIRVGTFAVYENAEKLVGKLNENGIEAYVKPVIYSGKSLTLVMIGPHADEKTAQMKLSDIQKRYGLRGQVLQEDKS